MAAKTRKESEEKPVAYIHISEFLAKKPELSEYDKSGFEIYMRGRKYQHSLEDFEKDLHKFFNRER